MLLDLNMPVMNGWEFLEQCDEEVDSEEVFVVIITSSIYKEDLFQAVKDHKVLDFCTNPIYPKDVDKIKNLKEMKKFFS